MTTGDLRQGTFRGRGVRWAALFLGIVLFAGLVWRMGHLRPGGPRVANPTDFFEVESQDLEELAGATQESTGTSASQARGLDRASTERTLAEPLILSPLEAGEVDFVLAGSIVEREGGLPIEGATVALVYEGAERLTVTDAEGLYELPGERASWRGIRVAHPLYVDLARLPFSDEEGSDTYEWHVELAPSGSISGHLLGTDEFAQAEVHVWAVDHRKVEERGLGSFPIDSEGHFVIPDLNPGGYSLACSHPKGPTQARRMVVVREAEATEITVELQRGAKLECSFLWSDETPVSELEVTARTDQSGLPAVMESASELRAVTDEEGEIVLEGLASGTLRLSFEVPGLAPQVRRLEIPRAGADVQQTIYIPKPASLRGTVVDAEQRLVPGARLRLTTNRKGGQLAGDLIVNQSWVIPEPSNGFALDAVADAHGEFVMEPVPAGQTMQLWAFAPEGDMGDQRLPFRGDFRFSPEEEQQINIALLAGDWVEGVVKDAETGQPLAAARVTWGLLNGPGDWGAMPTATDGRFRVGPVPQGGMLRLEAQCPGYGLARWQGLLRSAASHEVLLMAKPANDLRGRVLEQSGYAVSHARVRLMRRLKKRGRKTLHEVTTDEFGSFEFLGIQDGAWILDAQVAGYEPRLINGYEFDLPGPLELDVEMLSLPLEPRCQITARVVSRIDGLRPEKIKVNGTRNGVLVWDGDELQLIDAAPGQFRLKLTAPGHVQYKSESLAVAPGARLHLGVIEMWPETRLSLKITNESKQAPPGLKVTLHPLPVYEGGIGEAEPQRSVRRVQGDGSCSMRVEQAAWRLRLTAKGFHTIDQTIELEGKHKQTLGFSMRSKRPARGPARQQNPSGG